MKRILTLLLAIVLVAALLPAMPAHAFDDFSSGDEELLSATETLSALGIINGYKDGSFKPGRVVTRAEMAKMLAIASGLSEASTGNATITFLDTKGHWADDKIKLAAETGIITGRGNGIFDPDACVTYEEASVMMLRTLGYTNSSVGGSPTYDPDTYTDQAVEHGLFESDVQFETPAIRGDIALAITDLLATETVVSDDSGAAHGTGNKLISKIATVDPSFNVTARELANGHLIDLTDYIYENLTVYKNCDGKGVYVVKSNVATYTGYLKANAAYNALTITTSDKTTMTLTLAANSIPVYYNGAQTTMTEKELETKSCEVRLVANSQGSICGAACWDYAPPVQVSSAYVAGKATFAGFNLPVGTDKKVDLSAVTVEGDATSLESIKVGDIIECAAAADRSRISIIVTRSSVEGKVTQVAGDYYYINGIAYHLNGIALEPGDEGIFYLDRRGYIAAFSDKESDALQYGILLGCADGAIGKDAFSGASPIMIYPKVRLVDMNGRIQLFEVAVSVNANGAINSAAAGVGVSVNDSVIGISIKTPTALFEAGHSLVNYTVNKNGRIVSVAPVALTSATMRVSEGGFLADENTVILNYKDGNYAAVSAAELSDGDIDLFYARVDNGRTLAVTNDAAAKNTVNAVINSWARSQDSSGRTVYELTCLCEDEQRTFLTAAGRSFGDLNTNKCRVVHLTLDGQDRVTAISPYPGNVSRSVTASTPTSTYLVIKGSSTRRYFSEELVIYRSDDSGSVSVGDLSDLMFAADSALMDLYYDDNGDIKYAVVSPVYYVEPYYPTVVTRYGLWTSIDSDQGKLTFITADGQVSLPYSASALTGNADSNTVVKYTTTDGVVTSVIGLDRLDGYTTSETGGEYTATKDGSPTYSLASDTLVFVSDNGSCTVSTLANVNGQTVDLYLDNGVVKAIVRIIPAD